MNKLTKLVLPELSPEEKSKVHLSVHGMYGLSLLGVEQVMAIESFEERRLQCKLALLALSQEVGTVGNK